MASLSAATALLVLTGCSKEISQVNETVQTEITGSRAFFGSISCITDLGTKGGEVPLEETVQAIRAQEENPVFRHIFSVV